MNTYIVLLRAINVGGRNKISMAELRELLTDSGYANATTYLQSGNVVVQHISDPSTVASHVTELIDTAFGHQISVIVRTPEELQEVVAQCPYPKANPKQLGVVFLKESSEATCDASAFDPDACQSAKSHVYVHCPRGFGITKLTNAWVEKQTGSEGTRRNWNTVIKLLALAQGQTS